MSSIHTESSPLTFDIAAGLSDASTSHRLINQLRINVLMACLATNAIQLACAVGLGIRLDGRPDALFDEGGLVTLISTAELLIVACMAFCMFALQMSCSSASNSLQSGRRPRARWLWLLMAVGITMLALDEAFAIHERIDHAIHASAGLTETPLTDRLDDLIVLLYGVVALGTLWLGRAELRRFKCVRPLLALGFILFFIMVAIDLLTNSWSADSAAQLKPSTIALLSSWASVVEESFKLLSEGAFVAAFISMVRITRRRWA